MRWGGMFEGFVSVLGVINEEFFQKRCKHAPSENLQYAIWWQLKDLI
jgi:hypothetical protein